MLTAIALAGSAFAQDLGVKAPPQAAPVAIVGAAVHPVTGPVIERGVVVLENGLIASVGPVDGAAVDALRARGVTIVEAVGKRVYPGLIGAYTQLGLEEISAVRATLDKAEVGAATPEVRAAVAVNPDSTLIPVTRSAGVLIAGVFPATSFDGQLAYFSGPGGFMPGRASVMRLDGWTTEDMTIVPDAGLSINWPQSRPITAWWMNKSAEDQQKDIDRATRAIESMVAGARAYLDERKGGAKDGKLPTDIRYEAMQGIFADPAKPEGQRPVFIHAGDAEQITQAVTFSQKHGLKCVIVGGFEAPRCAELLKKTGTGVIVSGTMRFPRRDDSAYDEAFTLAARLEAAGVQWCMASGEIAAHERNLPLNAAMAVAHGLKHEVGVEAITIRPARLLGIADRYGSIEAGKSATLIVTDGDILEVATRVERAFIDGRAIDLSDKQKVLAEKYR
ncbi:MAG: amidohydrolase family protein, partial [Phycisphaerales bacterium]|nr:amidohydrolase family protein [Phycisphaerales bacterium]